MLSFSVLNIYRERILFFVTILLSLHLFSQELPPIQQYSPLDYQADDQNWSISQDENEIIYIANNKGLLEFNGARWVLNKTPNQSITRSVAVIESLIYTGSYMDFGYWERDNLGALRYTSLISKLNEDLIEDEEFWNIIPYEDFVLFQSLDRIYIYNTADDTFRIIHSNEAISKAFKIENSIYFQEIGKGIFKLENGKPELFTDNIVIKDKLVVNIFKNGNELLFQTRDDGFFQFSNGSFVKWNVPANDLISSVSVYNSIRLRNGNFLIGTISNGILQLDSSGHLLFQINRNNGLSNNTVLSAFQDISGNAWLGLDNGVAVLNLDSPYKIYNDLQGNLGTVYASEKTDEYLYLGTNQGLFFKPIDSQEKFKLIPNTEGQVWFLDKIGNELWCGHDKGTLLVENENAFEITSNVGTWSVKPFFNKSNLIVTGNYDGLKVLEKDDNGKFTYKNKLNGFNISSRYFEFLDERHIIVSHEYKGVFLLKLNESLTKIENYKKLDIQKGIGSSLVKFNGEIYYAYQEGIFKFNVTTNSFNKTELLADHFNKSNYASGKFVLDEENNRIWNFFNNKLTYLEPGKLTDKPVVSSINLPSALRKSKSGFENILNISNDEYLLGSTNGYITLNTSKASQKEYVISIDNISVSKQLQTFENLDLTADLNLKNRMNNLRFEFSVSDYVKLSPSMYQHRLIGIYDAWSDWTPESNVFFENLPHGDYQFEVRAKVGGVNTSNTASFKFKIDKPWYLQPLAIIGYIILFLIIAAIIQYFNRLYYKKQKKNIIKANEKELEIKELETQKQIMAFKNETLKQDIENKSRELGLSTMTLIRKNEFLNTLKKELNTLETTKELSKIIKIIDKNINNNEDWTFFEEAFNNADKDFLKKIKTKHPSLTPNDLKLCAYLRLNLSSKEIAPLLNISHRSVEVKRYRLRKKIQLPHEASLTNYILDI